MDTQQLIKQTRQLNQVFQQRSRKLTVDERMLDLMEEVGELAQAILIVEKKKLTSDPAKQRTKADIANALGDILFDLVLLADDYDLDLFEDYSEVLQELKARVESGEFDATT